MTKDQLAPFASAIRQARAEGGANVLLLDAGDAIGDTMIADESKGEAVLRLMNALGYDAMTLGNHEPDFIAARLRELEPVMHFGGIREAVPVDASLWEARVCAWSREPRRYPRFAERSVYR